MTLFSTHSQELGQPELPAEKQNRKWVMIEKEESYNQYCTKAA